MMPLRFVASETERENTSMVVYLGGGMGRLEVCGGEKNCFVGTVMFGLLQEGQRGRSAMRHGVPTTEAERRAMEKEATERGVEFCPLGTW